MDKRLVRVVWLDASDPEGSTSWYTDQDVDNFSAAECRPVSVGWVKSHGPKYLTLVADYILNENGTYTWGRPTKIPVGWIVSIEDLAVVPSTAQTADR